MIPRILHTIWLGGELRPIEEACLANMREMYAGWKLLHWPGPRVYEHPELAGLRERIALWIDNVMSKVTSTVKARAYVADMARLCALYVYGGVYFDADMWCVRPIDDSFLQHDIWFMSLPKPVVQAYTEPALRSTGFVGEAAIGAVPYHPTVLHAIERFLGAGVAEKITPALGQYARHNRHQIYPPEFFCPHPRLIWEGCEYLTTSNTRTIHCWRERDYDLRRLEQIRDEALNSHSSTHAA